MQAWVASDRWVAVPPKGEGEILHGFLTQLNSPKEVYIDEFVGLYLFFEKEGGWFLLK